MRAALVLAALAMVAAGCGGSGSPAGLRAATPPLAKRLLADRLRASHLTFHWVACVRTGRAYAGVSVVRCNVDFGDPHIEGYCAVLRTGRLLTNHDDPAIPCQHDDAGPPPTIVHS
jgi:hypothetical protein